MKSSKITIIGITGGSGSGKTSLLQSIRQHFQPDQVCMISQDNYYLPRISQAVDQHGYLNFDLPSSLDLEAFEQDIRKLRDGHLVERPTYVFNNEVLPSSVLVFKPAPVLVVEGLFLYARSAIKSLIEYSIYLHVKEDLKLIRRIQRDLDQRNYRLEEILHRYQHHVIPSYTTFIGHLREHADLVINNNESYQKGLDFLLAFIQQRIDLSN